jgi:hypothetical protein
VSLGERGACVVIIAKLNLVNFLVKVHLGIAKDLLFDFNNLTLSIRQIVFECLLFHVYLIFLIISEYLFDSF